MIQELLRDLFLPIALCPHRGCLCLAKIPRLSEVAFEFSEKIRSQMATPASLQASRTCCRPSGLFMTLMDLPSVRGRERPLRAGALFISSKGQRLRC